MLERPQIEHAHAAVGPDAGKHVLAAGKGQVENLPIVRNQLRAGRLRFNVPDRARRVNTRRTDQVRVRFVPIKAGEGCAVFRRFVVVEQALLDALDVASSNVIVVVVTTARSLVVAVRDIPDAQVVPRGGEQIAGASVAHVGTPHNFGAGVRVIEFARLVELLAAATTTSTATPLVVVAHAAAVVVVLFNDGN